MVERAKKCREDLKRTVSAPNGLTGDEGLTDDSLEIEEFDASSEASTEDDSTRLRGDKNNKFSTAV